MRIVPAWTKEMQALAEDRDVQAVVAAASIPGTLGTIAVVLRDHVGQDTDKLERSLDGARQVLLTLIEHEAYVTEAEAIQLSHDAIESMRALYANSYSFDDLQKKRGKVLEVLVHLQIADFYEENHCHMDCEVTGSGIYYRWLEGHEFDVCAWDDEAAGEAYECGVRPDKLKAEDYSALATLGKAIWDEYEDRDPWFRLGLVTFEHSRYVERLIEGLGPAVGDPNLDAGIEAYGYDNLMDLRK